MSNRLPWLADHTLNASEAEKIIDANADFDVRNCRLLGEGWDFRSFLVNDHWVFRFPKRRSEADRLVRERQLLDALTLPVNVPKFEIWFAQPTAFHLPIAGYRYIPGTPLDEFPPERINLVCLGTQLGSVLKALHRTDLTKPTPKSHPLFEFKDDLDEHLRIGKNYLPPAIFGQVSASIEEAWKLEPVVHHVTIHADFRPEHILLNARKEVVAIIDWADMCSSWRWYDFGLLWLWGGNQLLDSMVAQYGSLLDRNNRSLLCGFAFLCALAGIANKLKGEGPDIQVFVDQLTYRCAELDGLMI